MLLYTFNGHEALIGSPKHALTQKWTDEDFSFLLNDFNVYCFTFQVCETQPIQTQQRLFSNVYALTILFLIKK